MRKIWRISKANYGLQQYHAMKGKVDGYGIHHEYQNNIKFIFFFFFLKKKEIMHHEKRESYEIWRSKEKKKKKEEEEIGVKMQEFS